MGRTGSWDPRERDAIVGAEALRTPGLLAQVGAVGGRSITRTVRQRGLLVFPLLFPLMLFAINGNGGPCEDMQRSNAGGELFGP